MSPLGAQAPLEPESENYAEIPVTPDGSDGRVRDRSRRKVTIVDSDDELNRLFPNSYPVDVVQSHNQESRLEPPTPAQRPRSREAIPLSRSPSFDYLPMPGGFLRTLEIRSGHDEVGAEPTLNEVDYYEHILDSFYD